MEERHSRAAADDAPLTGLVEIEIIAAEEPEEPDDGEGLVEFDVAAHVGPYRLVRTLGEGGMGVVYEAVHTRLERRVAIKMIHPRLAEDESLRRRFLLEARAMSRVTHPSLVRVFDYGDDDDIPYLVMEYLDGEPLGARLRARRAASAFMDLGEALDIAVQCAEGLAAVHARNVVHRDIKPGNVMLVPDVEMARGERVKLLDFGLAKILDRPSAKTTMGVVMGTANYMAPEQCVPGFVVDGRTDVYALGVLLYEMLVGERLFSGTPMVIMQRQLREPAPRLRVKAPSLPPALADLVNRMLEKTAVDRPGMAEVATRLGHVARSLDLRVGATAWTPAPAPGGRRPRTGPGELALATFALIAMPSRSYEPAPTATTARLKTGAGPAGPAAVPAVEKRRPSGPARRRPSGSARPPGRRS